jgi:tight adherence protein C
MPLYVYAAAIAIISSIGLVWWGLSGPTTSQVVHRNLAFGSELRANFRQQQLGRSINERVIQPLVRVLGGRGLRLTPGGLVNATSRRVELAGFAGSWTAERVLATKFGLMLVVAFGGALWVVTTGATGPALAVIILLAVAAYLAPDAILSRLGAARQSRIELELPDVIDQLTFWVEAGLGLDAALARSARRGTGVVAGELARVMQDIQVGLSRNDALERLLQRTDSPSLRHVVLAIRQAELYGVPIASILRIQAVELRDRRSARAEERAMKIPVKIVFPLVFCILPALFVVILGPAAIQISDQFG